MNLNPPGTILAVLGALFCMNQKGEGEMLFWHDDYRSALAEAQATGRPLFLEFRCAP